MELTQNMSRQLNLNQPRLYLLQWDTEQYHIAASSQPGTLCGRDPNTTRSEFHYFTDARRATGCTICPHCWKAFLATRQPSLALPETGQ